MVNSRRYDSKETINNNANNANNINKNDNRNNDISEINKQPKKEEIKKGIYTLFGNVNCFICRSEFEQYCYCDKCMRLYCIECNKHYHKCNL